MLVVGWRRGQVWSGRARWGLFTFQMISVLLDLAHGASPQGRTGGGERLGGPPKAPRLLLEASPGAETLLPAGFFLGESAWWYSSIKARCSLIGKGLYE